MSSYIPHTALCAAAPDYEGIQLDAFFFVPSFVGLAPKQATMSEDEQFLVFSLADMESL